MINSANLPFGYEDDSSVLLVAKNNAPVHESNDISSHCRIVFEPDNVMGGRRRVPRAPGTDHRIRHGEKQKQRDDSPKGSTNYERPMTRSAFTFGCFRSVKKNTQHDHQVCN